jgi:signal transduction histidine kinase
MKILEPLFIITPVLLMLAIGIILFVFLYQRRMLQHQVQLRELQEVKQRQLLDATLQAQEAERRRVARDLHDDIGTTLALVKLNVHQLTSQLADKTGGQGVKTMLDDVIGNVRRISHDLMPAVLERMGLPQALEAMKRAMPHTANVQVEVTCNEANRRIDPKLELSLYRVVQELLNNTLKHAKADKITIDTQFGSHQLIMKYKDNGVGFDYEKLIQSAEAGSKGIGLINLQSRVNLLNGTFSYNSVQNIGTEVEISVPIV